MGIDYSVGLPDEVLLIMFKHCEILAERFQLGRVCRRWRKLVGVLRDKDRGESDGWAWIHRQFELGETPPPEVAKLYGVRLPRRWPHVHSQALTLARARARARARAQAQVRAQARVQAQAQVQAEAQPR